MDQFKLHIHHRAKNITTDEKGNTVLSASPGHFFVSLQDGHNISYFGKYPTEGSFDKYIYSEEVIKTKEERAILEELTTVSAATGEEYVTTKTFKLTEDQYKKALKYAKNKSAHSNKYTIGICDCTDYVQSIYNATGLPLYFTIAYSRQELLNFKSLAALKVLNRYGSRDTMPQQFHCMEALTKEELISRLNIDLNKVVQIPIFNHWDLPQITDKISIQFHVNVDDATIKSLEDIILKDNIFDVDLIRNRLHDIFTEFKINDNTIVQSNIETSVNDEKFAKYPNFGKLKDIIISELKTFREKFDKLRSTNFQTDSHTTTQEELIKIYEEKIKELQDNFKATNEFAQNNPGQYKYEPGETLPGSASFNREQLKLSQWLTDQLSKLPNPPFGVKSAVSDTSSTILQAKFIDNWNYSIEHLAEYSVFNEDLKDTLGNVDGIQEIIRQYLENFIEEQETICQKM